MSSSVAPSRKAYHHGDLRQALIRAAKAEVERAGPESVSLSALAKALGVSQPAPYRHFADREALLAAVATEGFQAFAAAIRAAEAEESARPALSRMARAYVAFGREHPGLYRLMFASVVVPNAPRGGELDTAAGESFAILLQAVPPAPDAGARMRRALKIWAGLHGVVMLSELRLLVGKSAEVTIEQLADDIVA
ncbi:MAG: TetR/AcrR family transcriptional regulator [Caulobacteraceae bacterium]